MDFGFSCGNFDLFSQCKPRVGLLQNAGRCKTLFMSRTFETLVDQLRTCSMDEKRELKFLLERALIEERRRELRVNHRRSQDEVKRGKLRFSSSVSDLKRTVACKD